LLSFKANVDLLGFQADLVRFNSMLKKCEDENDDEKRDACKNALIKPEFSWSAAEELTIPGIPIQADFSLSISNSSEGFIAWKQMDGSVFNMYSRRFNGNEWSQSELMEIDDRGDVGFVDLQVANDGHAILVWSSDNGDGLFSLKARAYVYDDNQNSRNFAQFRLLNASLSSEISTASLVMDKEGNANLSVLLQNNRILNYRYQDNRLLSQSWEEQDSVAGFLALKGTLTSAAIAEDGRMAVFWTELTNGAFTLQSSLFIEDTSDRL
jgi:hypothetical protein